MNKLSLVRVSSSQLDLLQQISLQTFYDGFFHLNNPDSFNAYVTRAFSREKLFEEINAKESEFYFLYEVDALLGYIKINGSTAQSDINDPKSLEIERIYITKENQNKGLGKFLLDQIKDIATERNLEYIWLGVWEKNLKAIRFYERYGFTLFGSHEFMMGTEVQIDLLMKLGCRL